MKTLKNKKVVISGGSSGIGKAIIKELIKEGAEDFAVIGRDLNKLKDLETTFPEANFLLLQGDISKSENILEFTSKIQEIWNSVDLLINSAGVVSAGALEKISDEDIINQVNINVTGLILLTKHLLPLLKKSEESGIVNVSSGLGLIGLPFYTPYAASKGAVRMFSEALRRELEEHSPIKVLTVYPTATDTAMMKSAKTEKMDTAELVAQKTIEGLMDNAIDVILGGDQRIADVNANAADPKEFDKKVSKMYDTLKERTDNHRSM
tara:strand:- start:9430 stop:10224 length:795 start_codon:yes stop_codon:yes gene_type:complete